MVLVISMLLCASSCALIPPKDTGTGDDSSNVTPGGDNNNKEDPPVDNPPVENPPVEDPPVEDPPIENPPEDDEKTTKMIIYNAKTSFEFGEEFSYDGITVKATLSDGRNITLQSRDYTVSCDSFNPYKVGNYDVTVYSSSLDTSATYQVSVTPANKLKVLMIGNSFADDAINYAYEIALNSGIPAENILIADIYIGGCSIDTHWANAQNNAPAYRFGLERNGYFNSSNTDWTMEEAIMYADWDFITFQQNSGNSGKQSSYSNLQKLMDYVYDVATDEVNNPNANPNVKFAWHQTWAYASNTTNSAFSVYGKNQMTMYNYIMSCLQLEVLPKDFVAIIPNGTAIQNARTSYLGDNLTRDQYDHLTNEAGRYIAAMGLVGTLTGRDMSAITWKPADSGFSFVMNSQMIAVCKESFANATISPYQITNSKYLTDSTTVSFEGEGTQENPFLIQSAEDMWALSELTAGKNYGSSSLYFKLTADIDLSAENWQPICSSASSGWVSSANSFNANFDGNGKTITFYGNYTGDVWAKGLFSGIGGYVHDLIIKGDITIEKGRVGSLTSMALANARIENITSYVNISAGNNQVGGIIGYIADPNVVVKNCVNYGTITGRELVGGIVGGSWQNVTYIDCVNHGNITATSINVGGIAGEKFSAATVTNCSNDGKIIGSGIEATADVGAASNYAGYLFGVEKQ